MPPSDRRKLPTLEERPAAPVQDAPGTLEERFLAKEFEARGTPERRAATLADLASARTAGLQAEGATFPEAVRQATEEQAEQFGAVSPPAAPGLLEGTLRAALPRTTVARDPRQDLIAIGRSRLPEGLDEFLADRLTLDQQEALGGTPEDIADLRMLQRRQEAREAGGALQLASTLARSIPGPVARDIALAEDFLGRPVLPTGEEPLVDEEALERAFPTSDRPTTARGAGVPLESPEMAMLRFLGTVAPAVVKEGALALPSAGVTLDDEPAGPLGNRLLVEASRQAAAGESPADILADVYERSDFRSMPLESSLLGTRPEDRGVLAEASVSGRSWPARVWLRAMHVAEQGTGVAEDLEAAADLMARDLGLPDDNAARDLARKAAWTAGLGADLLVPWELPAAKVAKVGKAAKGIAAATDIDFATAVGQVAAKRRMDAPNVQADMVAARLEAGEEVEDILRTMPPELQDDIEVLLGLADDVELPPPSAQGTLTPDDIDLPPPMVPDAEAPTLARTIAGPDAVTRGAINDGSTVALPRGARDRQLELAETVLTPAARARADDTILHDTVVPGQPRRKTRGQLVREAALLERAEGLDKDAVARVRAEVAEADRLGRNADARIKRLQARLDKEAAMRADLAEASEIVERTARQAVTEAQDDLARRVIERGVDEPMRIASMAEWREGRDMLQRALAKGVPIADRRIMDGFRGRKGEAADLFAWAEPNRTPKTPEYRLMGQKDGNVVVVAEGNLKSVMSQMLARQDAGDVVMFRDSRDVAGWRQRTRRPRGAPERPAGQLVSNHDFAMPDERVIIDKLADKHPRAQLPDNKLPGQRNLAGLPPEAVEPFRRLAAAFMGVRPPKKVRSLAPEHQEFVGAVEQALRQRVRATFGTEDLVNPMIGVTVTRGEWNEILEQVNQAQKATRWDPKKVERVGDELHLDDATQKALADYAARFGRSVEPRAVMPAGELSDLQADILSSLAAKVSDRRLAVRETGRRSTEMFHTLQQLLHGARGRILREGGKLRRNGPLRWFDDNVRRRHLDRSARLVMDNAMRRLNNVGAEVLADLRKVEGTPADKLAGILKQYRPISRREASVVASLDGLNSVADVWAARRSVLPVVKRSLVDSIPDLYSNEPRRALAGLMRYRQMRNAEMEKLGRRVLEAAAPEDSIPGLVRQAKRLSAGQARDAWRAFLRDGFEAPEIEQGLRDVFGPNAKVDLSADGRQQLLGLAMVLKGDEVVADVAADLVEVGIGFRDPRMEKVLNHIMSGDTTTHEFTRNELAHGKVLLRRLGIEPGMMVDLKKFGGVVLPDGFIEELREALDAGIRIDEKDFVGKGADAANWMLGIHKDLLTVANKAYHLTNMLGAPFIALMNLGVKGTIDATTAIGRNPSMARELVARLSAGPKFRPTDLDGQVLVARDGRMHSVEDLERAMLQRGVATSMQAADNARRLVVELDRLANSDAVWNQLMENPRRLRDAAVSVSDTFERMFRTGVFLDAVEKGSSYDEAAEIALHSLHDYNDLGKADKSVVRLAVMFWTFHRKNTEAFFQALVNNPQRLGAQIRFATRQRGDEKDNAALTDADLARLVLARTEGADGRTYEISTGSMVAGVEGALMAHRLATALGGDAESQLELLGFLSPIFQVPAVSAADIKLDTGHRASSPGSNEVPQVLAEIMQTLNVDPFNLQPQNPRSTDALRRGQFGIAGQPKRWEATNIGDSKGARRWQLAKVAAGRFLTDEIPRNMAALGHIAAAFGYDTSDWQRPSPHGSATLDFLRAAGFTVRQRDPDPVGTQIAEQIEEARSQIRTEQREARVE